ncbi:MAG: hypothetical protein ACXVBW_14925, partial [Bdellovibrionota bacterium]
SASGHMEFQIKKFTPKEFPTESLQKTLQQCEVEEAKKFPLRIGTLQFFALYQDGKFQTLTKEVDDQAFSDELSGCFETALKAFTPPGPEKLEFRVKL